MEIGVKNYKLIENKFMEMLRFQFNPMIRRNPWQYFKVNSIVKMIIKKKRTPLIKDAVIKIFNVHNNTISFINLQQRCWRDKRSKKKMKIVREFKGRVRYYNT